MNKTGRPPSQTNTKFILKPEDFDYWTNKWWDRVEEYYTKTLS